MRCVPAHPQPRPGEVESGPALCRCQGRWRQLCLSRLWFKQWGFWLPTSLLPFTFQIDQPSLIPPPQCSLETTYVYVGIHPGCYSCIFLEMIHIICLDSFILAMSDWPMWQASVILATSTAPSCKRSSQLTYQWFTP